MSFHSRQSFRRGGPAENDRAERALAGWVTGGAGLAVLALGGSSIGVASIRASEIEELCGDGAEPPVCRPAINTSAATELSDEGRALEIGGWVSIGVGACAAAHPDDDFDDCAVLTAPFDDVGICTP